MSLFKQYQKNGVSEHPRTLTGICSSLEQAALGLPGCPPLTSRGPGASGAPLSLCPHAPEALRLLQVPGAHTKALSTRAFMGAEAPATRGPFGGTAAGVATPGCEGDSLWRWSGQWGEAAPRGLLSRQVPLLLLPSLQSPAGIWNGFLLWTGAGRPLSRRLPRCLLWDPPASLRRDGSPEARLSYHSTKL